MILPNRRSAGQPPGCRVATQQHNLTTCLHVVRHQLHDVEGLDLNDPLAVRVAIRGNISNCASAAVMPAKAGIHLAHLSPGFPLSRRQMIPRSLRGAKAFNVILSEAKNLVHIRGVASVPRSFASLRMTTVGRSARKSTVFFAGMTRICNEFRRCVLGCYCKLSGGVTAELSNVHRHVSSHQRARSSSTVSNGSARTCS